MDPSTRALIEDLYLRVRRRFGDAVFAEAALRGRGASSGEIEGMRGRIHALGEVLDLLDVLMLERGRERPRASG